MFDYDLNNLVFKEVWLQYWYIEGSGIWINIIDLLLKDFLGNLFMICFWDIGFLLDGFYEFRVVAICFSFVFLLGIFMICQVCIEREFLQVLGVFELVDGVLSLGDEISICFIKCIDCGQIFYVDILGNNIIGFYDVI